MKQYTVSGMSCAACSARVEKAVQGVEGVSSCSVNLLTSSMAVEGSASVTDVVAAVKNAGYGAKLKGTSSDTENTQQDLFEDRETPVLKKRLISSLVFLIVLMYFSMGHMWGLPLPPAIGENYIAIGIIQLLLTTAVTVINGKFFSSGFKALIKKAPNMDTLVALGAGAAIVYSTYALFAMTDAQLQGNSAAVMSLFHEFYFESAAMILTLITVGKMLEARSKGKTTNALKALVDLTPKTAVILSDGKEKEIPAQEIVPGDIFIVKPGASFPADGVIVKGECSVNEAALTGESIPVDKYENDTVSAATVNMAGYVQCRATKVGHDTLLAQIIRMVSDAASTKAPIAKAADIVSGIFVPVVMAIAALTTVIWLIAGEGIGFALARGISVLVISCPCALGLATPVAIMVGSGMGAKKGILFKTAAILESAGKTQIVVLDKTGTITQGQPEVTDILPAGGISAEQLLTLAYSLEVKSEHPLARAITKKAEEEQLSPLPSTEFKVLAGSGVRAVIDGKACLGGSMKFMSEHTEIPEEMTLSYNQLTESGKTPLFFSKGDTLMGAIAVFDTVKPDSPQAIRELQNMGIEVVMLTGDNQRTADAVKKQCGVDRAIAGVLPAGKEAEIRALKEKGRVMMVGDGINDAPALTAADVGVAIGAGTDIAIDSADVVLMNSNLSDIPAAIRLSRATLRNIHENLFWAFIYNAIGIPLAAGLLIPVFNLQLNPMFAAAAMSLSSFCVVTNALRLNFVKLHSSARDKKIRRKKEKKTMEKTLKIQGMMCPHCEGRVKKCLEELDGVSQAIVSHESGTAVVTLTQDISDDVLKKTIEDQGYTVL